jgi:hypothetical protein
MGRLVHTSLGSSYLIAHVLHYPPPPHANSFVIGTVVINNNQPRPGWPGAPDPRLKTSAGMARRRRRPRRRPPGVMRRRPAAEDGVPTSLQIPSHTHIRTARSPAPCSPTNPRRAPPLSLNWPLMRLCSKMPAPPQSLQVLWRRLCSQMEAPPQSLHAGALAEVSPCMDHDIERFE